MVTENERIDVLEKRVESLESERFDAGNELRESEADLHNDIERMREKLNDHLRIGPRTCGECRHPWRKDTWKNVAYNLACFNQRGEVKWQGEDNKACEDFEPRGESCTE